MSRLPPTPSNPCRSSNSLLFVSKLYRLSEWTYGFYDTCGDCNICFKVKPRKCPDMPLIIAFPLELASIRFNLTASAIEIFERAAARQYIFLNFSKNDECDH